MLTGDFRVATRNGPTTFYHGPNEPRGIDYELAKGYADLLGVELSMYVADQFQEILLPAPQTKPNPKLSPRARQP